jgi:hypothetical protein
VRLECSSQWEVSGWVSVLLFNKASNNSYYETLSAASVYAKRLFFPCFSDILYDSILLLPKTDPFQRASQWRCCVLLTDVYKMQITSVLRPAGESRMARASGLKFLAWSIFVYFCSHAKKNYYFICIWKCSGVKPSVLAFVRISVDLPGMPPQNTTQWVT